MGSYPSATLVYGVDLGPEEDWDTDAWYTEELEAEHGDAWTAAKNLIQSVPLVSLETYGNYVSGYTCLALATQGYSARAYDPAPVDLTELSRSREADDEHLRTAWERLHPGQEMPEPSWFVVVSFG